MNSSSLLSGIRGLGPELFSSHLTARLPSIVTWGLAIALGVQAAVIVLDLIPEQRPLAAAASPGAAPARADSRGSADVQGIIDAHLFGVADPTAPAGDPTDAPETRLSLVLAGTLAASDPKQGFGIIGESASNAKLYSVGDSVPGGARLNAVYGDRVILERAGQLEALLLPREYKGGVTNTTAPQAREGMGMGAPQTAGSQVVERVKRMIAQDPGSVAEIMRPQPVFANGQQRGYRVYPGRNRAQFARLGLRPGDLVMSVNGTPLDDPQRGMEIFRSIGSADQVRVTVERNGRPQELVLNMAQIANELPAEAAQPQPEPDAMVPIDQAEPMPPDPTE
jgi:general secretion pathway protein C